jgi:hypothetical protein
MLWFWYSNKLRDKTIFVTEEIRFRVVDEMNNRILGLIKLFDITGSTTFELYFINYVSLSIYVKDTYFVIEQ